MSNTNGTISEKGICFSNLKNQFCIFDNNNRNAAAATEASLFRWPLLIHKNVCYQNKKERYEYKCFFNEIWHCGPNPKNCVKSKLALIL